MSATFPPFPITAPLTNPSFSAPNPSGGLDLDGIIGGGQIGWNFQSGIWVFGMEADLQASGQNDSRSVNGGDFNLQTGGGNFIVGSTNGTIEEKRQWLGTLRGRVGQTWNNILIYGTGGLAYGKVKFSGTETIGGTFTGGGGCFGGCSYSGNVAFGGSETKLGWTIGFGLEGAGFCEWLDLEGGISLRRSRLDRRRASLYGRDRQSGWHDDADCPDR